MRETELNLARQQEHALLGAILLEAAGQPSSGILKQIAAIVTPDCFKDPRHRIIYETMLSLDGPLNEITIGALLPSNYADIFPRSISICPYWPDWESYAHVVAGQKPKTLPTVRGGAS